MTKTPVKGTGYGLGNNPPPIPEDPLDPWKWMPTTRIPGEETDVILGRAALQGRQINSGGIGIQENMMTGGGGLKTQARTRKKTLLG